MSAPAPFFAEVAEAPPGTQAAWLTAADGVRLRVASVPGGTKGTILLFPGRTEYIEKYGRCATEMLARGYSSILIDWRGQGLADRQLDDQNTGHVMHFADYQMDVDALLAHARAIALPEPFYLVAHSMGGCIGLRALMNGLPVNAAVFSAPMWGIAITGLLRPIAWSLSWAARQIRLGHRYAPGTTPKAYVEQFPFEDNTLTRDAGMFDYMQRQVAAHPELSLGGPSLHWLYEALRETRDMARAPAPDMPTVAFLGTNERVVDTQPIHDRMAGWPGAELILVEDAEHEVIMEVPETRERFFTRMDAHFSAHP